MSHVRRYSGISTINHWASALLVIAMLVLGLAAGGAPTEAVEEYIMSLHIGLGFFTLLFVLWRTAYRLYEGFPPTLGEAEWQRQLAWWVHRIILAVLLLQVLTGPLYLFTEGEGVDVFGWFTFYLPLSALSFLHGPAEWLHKFGGNYLIPLLLLAHFAGAVKHFLASDRESPADL